MSKTADDSLKFEYDRDRDVLTVEGIKYAGAIFRQFNLAPPNTLLKIIARADGVLTIELVK